MLKKTRRSVGATENSLERKPLQFSVGSDSDEDDNGKALPPPPPLIFRHVQDSHPPPSFAHVIVNRFLFRIFPKILLFLVIAFIAIALMPGGWRVALCAANILPPPLLEEGENITIIGHRGCEFPYPENSLEALIAASKVSPFVEVDLALTSDSRIVLMHDIAYNRTTNGTGLTCMQSLDYARSLVLKTPDHNPQGRIAQGKFCVQKRPVGTVPCTYRVPTLSEIFEVLPVTTRFMVDVKECYTPDMSVSAALCSNCTVLMERLRTLMSEHFINPGRVVFTSSEPASLSVFRKGMDPNSSYAFGADARYSHYKRSSFLKVLSDGKFDAVSMYVGLAAIRPDLVRAVRTSFTPDGSRFRDLYVWTIRRNFEFKLARCAGATKLISAEPDRVKKRLNWKDVGSLLAEAT